MNEPWSSHCNLATREAAGDNIIQRIMKRNSCTQTTTNLASAHSKTGGEIVSASRTQRSITKRIAVGVQTLPREMSSTPIESLIEPDTRYMNSQKPSYQNDAKCRNQSCQTYNTGRTCTRCNQKPDSNTASIRSRKGDAPIISQQTQTNYASDDAATESTCHRASQSTIVQQKQKEAKNQINASKSKCSCIHNDICSSINNNKRGSSTIEAKRTTEKRSLFTCALCSKQKSVADVSNVCGICQRNLSCTHENISESNSQTSRTHINMCECDLNVPVKDADGKIIGKSRQICNAENQSRRGLNYDEQNDTEKICACANDHVAHRNPEIIMAGTLCEHCYSSGKIDNNSLCRFECRLTEHQTQKQIYSNSSQDTGIVQQHKVQNSVLKCNCNEACSCNNNQAVKDIVKACKNYTSKPNVADNTGINKTERNCKHCRVCGAAYQNIRKCGCHQIYPKAVAYEMSFTKENTSKNETSDITPIMPKIPKHPLSTSKFDACACDMKRNSKNIHRSTLQVRNLMKKTRNSICRLVG